jgi:predicted porin
VTISGALDMAAFQNGKVAATTAGVATEVKTNSTSGNEGRWATSELRVGGTEDLGGGLKASFQLNSDMRGAAPGFVSRDRWLELSGGFGAVRLGNQGSVGNSAGFNAYTQTGTTGVGSTYVLGVNPGGAATPTESIERQANVINYTSPSFNGVTVIVGTAKSSSDTNATIGKAETTQTGLSVNYTAGPLSAGFGTTDRSIQNEASADVTKVKGNFVGASYNLGVATIGASIVNNDRTVAGTTNRDFGFTAFGVTVPMGAITLRASAYSGEDKGAAGAADDVDYSGNQISVTYALSKRTMVYAYTGKNQTKRAAGNIAGNFAKTTGTNIGLAHTF